MNRTDKKYLENLQTYCKQLEIGISQSRNEKMFYRLEIEFNKDKMKLCQKRIGQEQSILDDIKKQIEDFTKERS